MSTRPTPDPLGPSELLSRLDHQARVLEEQCRELGELRIRLYRCDQELGEARAVSELLLRSRVYRLLRALGRWGWLEHRIRRALQ